MVKGVSVVIPNYNGVLLFPETLHTVEEALQSSGKPYEMIIVDDCSTDGSVEYIRSNYPQIRVIQNEKNSGFSVTANRGILAATYDKVLLLNSDVKLTPGYFINQFKYFDDPGTFGVFGRIIGWEDDIIQDGAKWPHFHGAKIKTSKNYLLNNETLMQDGLYSMYLSGANAFLDKEKFALIHGLNEIFSPFYVEDYELSLRAWRLGFKCYYDYNSVCKHQVSTSIKSKSRKRYVDMIYDRNKMYLHAIHLEGSVKVMWYLQLIPELLFHFVLLRWYYLKSFWRFITSFGKVRHSKKEFEALTKITGTRKSVKEVAQTIWSSVDSDKRIL